MKTDVNGLAIAIERELTAYSSSVRKQVKEAVRAAAKLALKEVKAKSPVRTGSYKKGWVSQVQYDQSDELRIVVGNKNFGYLTHLLENGHAKRNGGRVDGIPHIQPAELAAQRYLEKAVEEAIKNG